MQPIPARRGPSRRPSCVPPRTDGPARVATALRTAKRCQGGSPDRGASLGRAVIPRARWRGALPLTHGGRRRNPRCVRQAAGSRHANRDLARRSGDRGVRTALGEAEIDRAGAGRIAVSARGSRPEAAAFALARRGHRRGRRPRGTLRAPPRGALDRPRPLRGGPRSPASGAGVRRGAHPGGGRAAAGVRRALDPEGEGQLRGRTRAASTTRSRAGRRRSSDPSVARWRQKGLS